MGEQRRVGHGAGKKGYKKVPGVSRIKGTRFFTSGVGPDKERKHLFKLSLLDKVAVEEKRGGSI